MDLFRIHGEKALKGAVNISGSKNAALPMLIASILSDEPTSFSNLASLSDISFTLEILKELGANIEKGKITKISFSNKVNTTAPYDLVRKMRASVLVLAPLLAKYGHVKVSLPGGCAIGARPVDLHIKAMESLGAKVDIKDGYIVATANKLKGAEIIFPFISVGATQSAIMGAVISEGISILRNVSIEPETIALANMLNDLGANITGIGTNTLKITGVKKLGKNKIINIPSDRIEAGTFLIAAVATKGKVKIENVNPTELKYLLHYLKELKDIDIKEKNNSIEIDATLLKEIKPSSIVTAPYPGFPTDLQAQWMAFMSIADGVSTIEEKMFENRFMHVGELFRLGANIKLSSHTATIIGVKKLKGAELMATDLRASAGLVIAGLIASGETKIHRVYHIDRGYEQIDLKLKKLGASITREKE